MECFAEPCFIGYSGAKESYQSSFENDNIFEFINLDGTSSPRHNQQSHYSPSTEKYTEQARDGAADTLKFARNLHACDVEARLRNALQNYASSPCEFTGTDSLIEEDRSIVESPQIADTPFDSFIPSPPRTPEHSPASHFAERFEVFTVRRQKSKSPTHVSTTRIYKSPRKLNLPAMLTASHSHPASFMSHGRSAGVLNPPAYMGDHYLHTPSYSASYKSNTLPRSYASDTMNKQNAAQIPSGYICPDNTPVDAFFEERLTSNSSIEDVTFAGYDTPSQPSQQTWGRSAMRQQQKAAISNLSNMGLGISGPAPEGNIGVAPAMLSKQAMPTSINGLPRTSNQVFQNGNMGSHASPRAVVPAYMQHGIADRDSFTASSMGTPIHSPMPVCPPMDVNQLWPNPAYNYATAQSSPDLNHAGHYYTDGNLMMAAKQPARGESTNQHRRTKSGGYDRRKKSSSLSKRHSSMGFLNLTPSDSTKILNGVAPSGSSKTKARREKEAAEKIRKQIEAAKKAVERAGGDVGIFQENGMSITVEDDEQGV
jgi:hypothetical protein